MRLRQAERACSIYAFRLRRYQKAQQFLCNLRSPRPTSYRNNGTDTHNIIGENRTKTKHHDRPKLIVGGTGTIYIDLVAQAQFTSTPLNLSFPSSNSRLDSLPASNSLSSSPKENLRFLFRFIAGSIAAIAHSRARSIVARRDRQ